MSINIISTYKDNKIFFNHVKNQSPNNSAFDLHTHDICELIFLKKGDVSGIINGKIYKLKKNDLIIFRPRVLHGIQIDTNKEYERINILFDEKKIANKAFEKVPQNLDVINYSGNNYMIDIFNKFDFYYNQFDNDNLKTITTNLVEEIIFNLTLVKNKEISQNPFSVNSNVNTAIEFIDKNYTLPITIDDICNELYISKSHLHHLFIDNLHISPKKYINLQRLSKAQSMIKNGSKPYDIYLSCGFKDYATFYRNYKVHFGHIPSMETEKEIERKIKS